MIGYLGLGAMGRPIAANLAAAGPLKVWNRTGSVAERFATEHRAVVAAEPAELADVDVLFTCLPTTAEVSAVAEQLVGHLRAGTVWVDNTSGDPAASRELAARLAEHGIDYLDAPVSGGVDGAAAGTLTVMVGGEADVLDRVRPSLEVIGDRVVHLGPTGAGHATKAVNNALLATSIWAAAEGLSALAAAGVPASTALEVINHSSGRSAATQGIFDKRVLNRDFALTFALTLLAKDVRLAGSVLRSGGVDGAVLALVERLTDAAAAELGEEADHTEIARLVERAAGVELSRARPTGQ